MASVLILLVQAYNYYFRVDTDLFMKQRPSFDLMQVRRGWLSANTSGEILFLSSAYWRRIAMYDLRGLTHRE